MHEFRDSKNRPWRLELNCDTVEEIKAQCAVNVLDLLDPQSDLAKEIAVFPPVIGKLLFAAVSDQAKTAGVDDREFRRSMNGETLNAAYWALQEEVVLFSPRYRQRVAAAILDKNREVQAAAEELALERLADPGLKSQVMEALDNELRKQMSEALKRIGKETPRDGAETASAIASSTAAGGPPDCSDFRALDLTPGETSAA